MDTNIYIEYYKMEAICEEKSQTLDICQPNSLVIFHEMLKYSFCEEITFFKEFISEISNSGKIVEFKTK